MNTQEIGRLIKDKEDNIEALEAALASERSDLSELVWQKITGGMEVFNEHD